MTTTATALIAELRSQGFRAGPPAHLWAECLVDDIANYSMLECPACGHARHRVTPYHHGRAYRLVCVCRSCGNAIET